MQPPRFQIGEERLLRRPLTTIGGAEVMPDTRIRVLSVESVEGEQGQTYLYRLCVVSEDEGAGDMADPNKQLELSQIRLKSHSRECNH